MERKKKTLIAMWAVCMCVHCAYNVPHSHIWRKLLSTTINCDLQNVDKPNSSETMEMPKYSLSRAIRTNWTAHHIRTSYSQTHNGYSVENFVDNVNVRILPSAFYHNFQWLFSFRFGEMSAHRIAPHHL